MTTAPDFFVEKRMLVSATSSALDSSPLYANVISWMKNLLAEKGRAKGKLATIPTIQKT